MHLKRLQQTMSHMRVLRRHSLDIFFLSMYVVPAVDAGPFIIKQLLRLRLTR